MLWKAVLQDRAASLPTAPGATIHGPVWSPRGARPRKSSCRIGSAANADRGKPLTAVVVPLLHYRGLACSAKLTTPDTAFRSTGCGRLVVTAVHRRARPTIHGGIPCARPSR